MSSTLDIRGSIPEIVKNSSGIYEGNLVDYFRIVFNHAKNLNHPYHNFRHLCHVLWLCYSACIFYDNHFYGNQLSLREKRNLLIAALFHDFDHTGKAGPDITNIERALNGLKCHLLPEDDCEYGSIVKLILMTEYPYTIPSENLGVMEQVLRDADMSQAFSVAWIQQVVFGLSVEWGKPTIEILKMQGAFLGNIKFHSAWAQHEFPGHVVKEKIAEAQELFNLLAGEPIAAG